MPLSKEPADMTLPELAQAMWGEGGKSGLSDGEGRNSASADPGAA